jgi:hypothetical protein
MEMVAAGTLAVGLALTSLARSSDALEEPYRLSFDSEWIGLRIVGDSVEVRGTFVYLCGGGGEHEIPLLLPFPQEASMGGARMVSLRARTGSKPFQPARWDDVPLISGARWWLPACQGDSIVAEMCYRQRIEERYASYVVTTVRHWGHPLRSARFEIRLPKGAEPAEFSHPFELREVNGENVFVYDVLDFFPDRDISVRWTDYDDVTEPRK